VQGKCDVHAVIFSSEKSAEGRSVHGYARMTYTARRARKNAALHARALEASAKPRGTLQNRATIVAVARPTKLSLEQLKAGLIAGLRPRDIAAAAGCSVDTVERQIRRMRAQHGPSWPIEATAAKLERPTVRLSFSAPAASSSSPGRMPPPPSAAMTPEQHRASAVRALDDVMAGLVEPQLAGAVVAAAKAKLALFPPAPPPPPKVAREGLRDRVRAATIGAEIERERASRTEPEPDAPALVREHDEARDDVPMVAPN
jgi:hypothetical protein